MSKVIKTFSTSTQSRRGSGHISWSRFQAMLRQVGMLRQGERLEKVTVTEESIEFTTDKTGNQK